MYKSLFGSLSIFAAISLAEVKPAKSYDEAGSVSHMALAGITSRPIGHVQFCRRNPTFCSSQLTGHIAKLDQRAWHELIAVNTAVNRQIVPVTDQELYRKEEVWTLPVDRGDCEDYALLKKQILLERGWPESALLLTVVRDTDGEGHAVLTVSTDLGDFILDNQIEVVLPWADTPYEYLKRQSHFHGQRWVAINDARFEAQRVAQR